MGTGGGEGGEAEEEEGDEDEADGEGGVDDEATELPMGTEEDRAVDLAGVAGGSASEKSGQGGAVCAAPLIALFESLETGSV